MQEIMGGGVARYIRVSVLFVMLSGGCEEDVNGRARGCCVQS